MAHSFSANWPPVMEVLPDILQWAEECLSSCGLSQKLQQQIILVTEEIVVNVLNYAQADSESSLCLEMDIDDKTINLQIIDEGAPFNPLHKQDPDITENPMDRKAGGLGIFFVKKLVDEIEYRRSEERNILSLVKNIQSS